MYIILHYNYNMLVFHCFTVIDSLLITETYLCAPHMQSELNGYEDYLGMKLFMEVLCLSLPLDEV